jgi:hypothetical protein
MNVVPQSKIVTRAKRCPIKILFCIASPIVLL